jgi:casein kinase 1
MEDNSFKLKKNQKIGNYIVQKFLDMGSFGYIYLCINNKNEERVLKIGNDDIRYEYEVYKELKKKKFVKTVNVYELIEYNSKSIIIMEKMRHNLEYINNKNAFNMVTIVHIGLKIIEILEQIHINGYIYIDIKPNNFLLDTNNNINIIDFGLSKKYINKHDKHIKFSTNNNLIGTLRYASISNHMGFELSRRDDLESLAYMLIRFATKKLQWQDIQNIKKENEIIEKIKEMKMCFLIKKKIVPECIIKLLEYSKKMRFTEEPKYEEIKNNFIKYIDNTNTTEKIELINI